MVINPLKVFTGGLPKDIGGTVIQTDKNGRVVKISNKEEVVTLVYNDVNSRSVKTPDVVMTVVDTDNDKSEYRLFLNKDGFVSHCSETSYSKIDGVKEQSWSFDYNSDGQLKKFVRSEGGNETTTITYNNGDAVSVSMVSAEEPGNKKITDVHYTSSTATSPIVNKGCLMFFDGMLDADLDEMEYAYYAGLLGKATKHLPVGYSSHGEYGDEMQFNWTVSPAGYPVSVECIEIENGKQVDSEVITFTW